MIPAWFTTKASLWMIGVLLALLLAAGGATAVQTIRLDAAHAKVAGLEEQVKGVAAQRDATIAANNGYHDIVGRLTTKLQEALAENERVITDGAAAVERAEAARVDADRTLAGFVTKFANRAPTCDAALRQMEAACPALSDY